MSQGIATGRTDSQRVIVMDSREKAPWSFRRLRVAKVQALPAGDYSLLGLVGVVAVERKSVEDLVRTLTVDSDRWFREVDRLREHKASCVVVEGTLHAATSGGRFSSATRGQLLRAIAETVALGIPVLFANDRPGAIAIAEAFFEAIMRQNGPQAET